VRQNVGEGWAVGNRRHALALLFVRFVRFVVELLHCAGPLAPFVFFAVERLHRKRYFFSIFGFQIGSLMRKQMRPTRWAAIGAVR
jgi:hypothetical protein